MKSFLQYITESKPPKLQVKPSSTDPHEIASANFEHGLVLGNKTLNIGRLQGGVRQTDSGENERVQQLANQISSPQGYISRLVVDTGGNVLEGQHRLEALRKLNVKKIPVTVVKDLAAGFNTEKIRSAIRSSNPGYHPDQVHQMTHQVLHSIHQAKSPQAALVGYRMPEPHTKAWEAGLRAAQNPLDGVGSEGT